jgi:hypothetical protein
LPIKAVLKEAIEKKLMLSSKGKKLLDPISRKINIREKAKKRLAVIIKNFFVPELISSTFSKVWSLKILMAFFLFVLE